MTGYIWPKFCLLLALMLAPILESQGFSNDVTIRLINVKDGKPLENQLVVLSLGDARKASTPVVKTVTSSEGMATIHLPDPLPEKIFIDTENGKIRACYLRGEFSTPEIIERGVLADNICDSKDKLRGKFTPKPGEVIVFVRFLRWWERMQT